MSARTAIIAILCMAGVLVAGAGVLSVHRIAAGFAAAAPRRNPEVMYDTRYGRAMCAARHISDCGVTLSECADTNIYACLHDVRWEDQTNQGGELND